MGDRELLAGQVLAFVGRGEGPQWRRRDAAWLGRLAEALGATAGPLGASTTWVVTGTRPSRVAIQKAQKRCPELRVTDVSGFLEGLVLPPAVVAGALGDEAGRAWLATLRELGLGALSVAGQTVRGVLTGPARLDVTGADLRAVEGGGTIGLHGRDADFRGARLQGWAGRVDLVDAVFDGADLTGVELKGEALRRCSFRDADLTDAKLHPADLRESDLRGARVEGAEISGDVRGARFDALDLSEAQVWGNLSGASFRGARLALRKLVTLGDADLREADLSQSDLTFLDLRDARLDRAVLGDTDTTLTLLPPRVADPPDTLTPLFASASKPLGFVLPVRLAAGHLVLRVQKGYSARIETKLELQRAERRTRKRTPENADFLTFLARLPSDADIRWNEANLLVEGRGYGRLDSRPARQNEAVTFFRSLLDRSPEPSRVPATHVDHEGLFAAILADREDDSSWAVLADWLTEAGDPRGPLIAREVAADPSERAALARHHAHTEGHGILGDLALETRWGLTIERCFVDQVYISSATPSGKLSKLAAHPSTRLLRRVSASTVRGKLRGLVALLTQCPVQNLRLPPNAQDVLEKLPPLPSIRLLELEYVPVTPFPEVFSGVTELTLLGTHADGPEPDLTGFPALTCVRARHLSDATRAAAEALGIRVESR